MNKFVSFETNSLQAGCYIEEYSEAQFKENGITNIPLFFIQCNDRTLFYLNAYNIQI